MALTDNLVAGYRCEETSGDLLDVLGVSNLTDHAGTGSAVGIAGNARDYEFDATQFHSIADNTALSMGDVDFTITCWVKAESIPAFPGVLGKGDGSGTLEYWLFYHTGLNRFRFGVSGDGSGNTFATADSYGALSPGQWAFIVCRHDSVNNVVSIQINDGPVDSASFSAGVFDGSASFRIGRSLGTDPVWDGLIDEVFIWKNRILSAADGTTLYGNGNGLAYPWGPPAGGGGSAGTGTAGSAVPPRPRHHALAIALMMADEW